MRSASELTTLVETEQRLDQAVASARTAANATREAARERARISLDQLEESIEGEQMRIARAMATEISERERTIELDARVQIARFESVTSDELQRIASALAMRLVEITLEEP